MQLPTIWMSLNLLHGNCGAVRIKHDRVQISVKDASFWAFFDVHLILIKTWLTMDDGWPQVPGQNHCQVAMFCKQTKIVYCLATGDKHVLNHSKAAKASGKLGLKTGVSHITKFCVISRWPGWGDLAMHQLHNMEFTRNSWGWKLQIVVIAFVKLTESTSTQASTNAVPVVVLEPRSCYAQCGPLQLQWLNL